MNKKIVMPSLIALGSMITGSIFGAVYSPKSSAASATTGHVTTNLGTYYDSISNAPDGSYFKYMDSNVDYPLGDGTIVNMNAAIGSSNNMPQVRDYKNTHTNYYIYLKYNSTHNAVGQLGNELIFNAKAGYLLDSVDLFNGYQVGDAFQIEIYNFTTGEYDVDAVDQMFSGSNATYSYTFTKPTTSFKVVHYLHSTETHTNVAWKETSVYYETAYSLIFDSRGGTAVDMQTYAEDTTDVTFEPTAPVKANVGTTKYTFAGWYTDENCTDGNEFVFGNVLTQTTTLYAKWTESTVEGYTITFNSMGGSAVASQTVEPNGVFVEPSAPTKASDAKYDYTFANWYSDEALTSLYDFDTPATADITVYAKYSYTQTNLVGATVIDLKTNVPTYTAGWDSSFQEVDIKSSDINAGMVDSVLEVRKSMAGKYGIKKQGEYDVQIKRSIVTWQLNDYSKYIQAVRWDLLNTAYQYSTDYIVHLYKGRGATGALVDSDYVPLTAGASYARCVQMTGNVDETLNAVSFKNDNAASFAYGYGKIRYILGDASDAQQAKFFAEAFLREFTCDGEGSITNDVWEEFEDRIENMSSAALALLKAASHSDENLGAAMTRYDYVIHKYGVENYSDFLHRTDDGGGYSPSFMASLINSNTNSDGAIIVALVITISLIAVLSLGVVIYRKKRIQ